MEKIGRLKYSILRHQEMYFLMFALFGYIFGYLDPYYSDSYPHYINFLTRAILLLFSFYFIIKNADNLRKRKVIIAAFSFFFLFYLFKLYRTIPSVTLSSEALQNLKSSIYYFGFVVIPIPVVALLSLDYQKIDFRKFFKGIFWFYFTLLLINFIHTNFVFDSYASNGRSGIFRLYYITVGHYGLSLLIMSLYSLFFLKIKGIQYALGLLLGLFPMYVSAARSPILALLAVLLIFIIVCNKRKYWLYFFGLLLLSLIALYFIYKSKIGEEFIFFKRLNEAIFEKNASGRSFYLNKGLDIFTHHPFLGGYALFNDGSYSHNIFVDILMSTGLLGMALFIIYFKFVVKSFFKVLRNIYKYKESGILIFFFLQYFILAQTSGSLYSSFEFWYFGAAVIGLGYINFTNEEIKSNNRRGNTA
ncbi:O-antigen ligase [Chryseobacterium sp. SLBN-27]|uniref:O-antigen ligase family protein n=1 Tax=Chryseobacterium sp. SLBN-27 TaxID=3042287 RepID=UPI002863D174|nr:O-antigen ligase family protein [Chryseobacterium sp. SLBN-27]MDR6158508.1 O-antigen ligase [Chryseobacterium sp. SLBN-27]